MSVKINLHQSMRHLAGDQAIVEVTGNRVGECLGDLVARFPAIKEKLFNQKGELLNHIEIYVNAQSAYPEELKKPVADGDVLSITLMIAGG